MTRERGTLLGKQHSSRIFISWRGRMCLIFLVRITEC